MPFGRRVLRLWTAGGGRRIAGGHPVRGRKVRAPLGREVDNADPGRPEGKRNRKDTADGGRLRSNAQVRVKSWGKSPRATAG